ncbi:MAG TPA: nucleoside hydrolase [Planctomycetota bacterium]|nr:nucleoside hydrolase [Planctomycetota bacterium]
MSQCPLLAFTFVFLAAAARPAPSVEDPAADGLHEKLPVALDTDLAGSFDDAFALALLLSSPEVDLRAVTTVGGDAHTRALVAARFLDACGRRDVPVAAGGPSRARPDIEGQLQYGLRPSRAGPVGNSVVDLLQKVVDAAPGAVTILALGPLTNVARLLEERPEVRPRISRIVLMGGSLRAGYTGRPPAEPEWNIRGDPEAARTVLAAGVPVLVAPLDAAVGLLFTEPLRRRVLEGGSAAGRELQALYQLQDHKDPPLFDAAAVMLALDERYFQLEEVRIEVDADGSTREVPGTRNARAAVSARGESLLEACVERIARAEPRVGASKLPVVNPSSPVVRGGMPGRVHVIEDYETDIERRWWLSGRLEDVPGGGRVCRGVLSADFDDLMGDPAARYTAVVFNPVPGPPMGARTRLSFRCFLEGSSALRVQIYSLTNGYHRALTLRDLAAGSWQTLTVDMTAARRPDGSGGPLAADERIDDIQFYADLGARLLVDDIVLYDEFEPGALDPGAEAARRRPFPRRPVFTAWFDTGKQGAEWPGAFEIVPRESPPGWKAARSVPRAGEKGPWIRLGLRGDRPLGKTTRLRFSRRMGGTGRLTVAVQESASGATREVQLADLERDAWRETDVEIPAGLERASEIRFLLEEPGDLLVDDVMIYEP